MFCKNCGAEMGMEEYCPKCNTRNPDAEGSGNLPDYLDNFSGIFGNKGTVKETKTIIQKQGFSSGRLFLVGFVCLVMGAVIGMAGSYVHGKSVKKELVKDITDEEASNQKAILDKMEEVNATVNTMKNESQADSFEENSGDAGTDSLNAEEMNDYDLGDVLYHFYVTEYGNAADLVNGSKIENSIHNLEADEIKEFNKDAIEKIKDRIEGESSNSNSYDGYSGN